MKVLLVLDRFEQENRYWKSGKIESGPGHELEIIHLRSKRDSVLKVEINNNFIVLNNRVFKKPELFLISHYNISHSDDPRDRAWVKDIEINGKSLKNQEIDVPSLLVTNKLEFILQEYEVFIATIRSDGISRLITDFRENTKRVQKIVDQCI